MGDESGGATGAPRRWQLDLRDAAGDVVSVAPGVVLLGISFGLMVVGSGLAWWWAPVFSGVVFAGSLEFLLIALVVVGTPLTTIAVTSLLVNGRHIFYGLSFPLHRIRGRSGRAYAVFALVDEAYALAASRTAEELTGQRILCAQLLIHVSWVGGGVVGALAGAGFAVALPALDFVFIGVFVVLAAEAVRAGREFTDPLAASACAVLARFVVPDQMLLAAMGSYIVVLVIRYRFSRRDEGRIA